MRKISFCCFTIMTTLAYVVCQASEKPKKETFSFEKVLFCSKQELYGPVSMVEGVQILEFLLKKRSRNKYAHWGLKVVDIALPLAALLVFGNGILKKKNMCNKSTIVGLFSLGLSGIYYKWLRGLTQKKIEDTALLCNAGIKLWKNSLNTTAEGLITFDENNGIQQLALHNESTKKNFFNQRALLSVLLERPLVKTDPIFDTFKCTIEKKVSPFDDFIVKEILSSQPEAFKKQLATYLRKHKEKIKKHMAEKQSEISKLLKNIESVRSSVGTRMSIPTF